MKKESIVLINVIKKSAWDKYIKNQAEIWACLSKF